MSRTMQALFSTTGKARRPEELTIGFAAKDLFGGQSGVCIFALSVFQGILRTYLAD